MIRSVHCPQVTLQVAEWHFTSKHHGRHGALSGLRDLCPCIYSTISTYRVERSRWNQEGNARERERKGRWKGAGRGMQWAWPREKQQEDKKFARNKKSWWPFVVSIRLAHFFLPISELNATRERERENANAFANEPVWYLLLTPWKTDSC